MTDIVNIDRSDRRRDWALALMAGGGMAMTALAGTGMWWLRARADYVFWLSIICHLHIFVSITGFAGLLMKRTIRATLAGNSVEISDAGGEP